MGVVEDCDRWTLTTTTAPTVEPVSLAEAKVHLNYDINDQDGLIQRLITAARQWCEVAANSTFVTTTHLYTRGRFPYGERFLRLPRPPLISVGSIKYYDTDNTDTTWSSSNYLVETGHLPGIIALTKTASWPSSLYDRPSAVRIAFNAGYGAAATDVPAAIRQAICVVVASMFEHREEQITGMMVGGNAEFAAKALLSPFSYPEIY